MDNAALDATDKLKTAISNLVTFTSPTTGIELKLRPVRAQLVARVLARPDFEPPPVPTYTVTLAGGVTEEYEHNEGSPNTPEEQAEWDAYITERNRRQLERDTTFHKFLIEHGIATEPPPPDQWGVDWQRWGIDPPDRSDPVEYKRQWIEEVVCPGTGDLILLFLQLQAMTGIDQTRVKEMERFFRPELARS